MRHTILLSLALCAACGDKDTGDTAVDTTPTDDTGADPGTEPVDADADGYSAEEDCDDADPAVNPGAAEVCDGADNNCDGSVDEGVEETFYEDADDDGYGSSASTTACEAPSGYVDIDGDCSDDDPAINPGAEEVCDDADTDEDCDGDADDADADVTLSSAGTFYQDADGDGFGNPDAPQTRCDAASGYVADDTDCNDEVAEANPVDGCWNGTWAGDLVASVDVDGFGTDVCKGTVGLTIDMTDDPMLQGTGTCTISLLGTLSVTIDGDISDDDTIAGSMTVGGIITDDWTGTIAESGLVGVADGSSTYSGISFTYEIDLGLVRD